MRGDATARERLRFLAEACAARCLPEFEAIHRVAGYCDISADEELAAERELEAPILAARRHIMALAALLLLASDESHQYYDEVNGYGLSPPKPLELLPQVQPIAPNA